MVSIATVASPADEQFLLNLLNSTPRVDGHTQDQLGELVPGRRWLAANGQPDSESEWRTLVELRSVLQGIVRGRRAGDELAPFVAGVGYRPRVAAEGIAWDLDAPAGRVAAARALVAWDALRVSSPGRLRPCANPECDLFLIDHSKPNSAKWCSMATCGNRMKARRHYKRAAQPAQTTQTAKTAKPARSAQLPGEAASQET